MEPTKIPCLTKGISAGLWVDLAAAWSIAGGQQPAVTCERKLGVYWGVIVGTFWLAALQLLLRSFLVQSAQVGGRSLILLSELFSIATGGLVGLLNLYGVLPCGLLLCCLLLTRVGIPCL